LEVYIERENKIIEVDGKLTGVELLKNLKINPETIILVRNNEVVLESEKLIDSDKIKILSVVSGG
jgi:sulfur carrier protein